jgi:hypothetical protein
VSAAAVLEGRYRRLLMMYPAEHRRKHQDEMLGVLMTGAHAGQRWPGLADTANLTWGALLIRLCPARPGTAWPLWRDALAVVSVVLPLAFLAYEIVSVTTVLTLQPVTHVAFIAFAQGLLVSAGAWVILTALVLLRVRRVAILATAGLLIWFLVATAGAPYWVGIDPGVMLTVAVLGLELAALLASAGPRRGIPLMTWRYYTLAVLGPAAVACVFHWVWLPHPLLANATVVSLVAITLTGMMVATPLSRRVALALSIPAYYLVVGYLVPPSLSGSLGVSEAGREGPLRVSLTVLPFAVLLCVALVVTRRTAWRAPVDGPAA